MNRIKKLRRVALLALVVAGSLSLAACNGSSKVPYGSLSEDTQYLTYDDYSISEVELYDQFRLQGVSVLASMIDDVIFSEYATEAETLLANADEDTLEYFYDQINSAVFNDTDEESLQELYDDSNDIYVMYLEQFVDSMYLLDNTIDADDLLNDLLNLATPFEGYESIPAVVNTYKSLVAQRLYAAEQLALDVEDEDSAYYVDDEDIVSYYQANTEGQYDVDALIVRFINLNEANAALYQVGLKSDSKGLWYEIPDIRIASGEAGYVDLTDEVSYGYIIDILDELGLLGKLGVDYADRSKLSISNFEDYYKAYTISTTRDGYPDVALNTSQVKEKFVELYNVLNPAATVEVDVDGNIVGTAGSSFETTYTYDDLSDINSSLVSHLYSTLTAETNIEDASTEKAYSSRIQTFGDFRYLVFKLDDGSADEDGILIEDEDDYDDDDDTDEEIFASTTAADAAKAQARLDLIDSKLSDSYISTVVAELYDDEDEVSIDIYDNILRTLYDQSYGYDGSDDNKDGNVVATVNGEDITVDAFYAEVEMAYGVNLSLDLLVNKILMDSDEYTVSDDDYDDYEEQFEDIIYAFSSDSYSSYPASMGREAFLLVAFGADSNEEAINQLYVYPDLRDQFLNDYESHYSEDTNTIYEKFAELSALQYDNEKSITVSHLLIYFDQDFDGTPDDPSDYLDTLTAVQQTEIMDGLQDLIDEVYYRAGLYTDFDSALAAIAEEFNDTGRILQGSYGDELTGELIDLQPELYWSEYRQLGFNMTFEAITTEITNSSNIITNSSVLDDVFYDRAISIFDTLAETPEDDSLYPYLDFYDEWATGDGISLADLELVESSFGWHFILAEEIGEKTSAIYSEYDDDDEDYIDADLNLNAYNENSEKLTASQIEYYLVLSETDEGAPLPSDVEDAITTYLSPVTTLYSGTYMQRELIFKLVEEVQFGSGVDSSRFTTIREINLRQFNNYQLSENGGVFDSNYDDLYGSWFDILEA
ncbi:hypothetical protein KHQ89_02880 [Mycoplasmatota bacterium]|nr:hypothetical protein KHQ89_02880 [Mycoplasmatota bacterium]